ncbi:MAG: hypothetical protein MK066_13550 [Crocinitomicaceae bacterium]|nr:hypothetical protein [Crocinitomicaceae bacterium]
MGDGLNISNSPGENQVIQQPSGNMTKFEFACYLEIDQKLLQRHMNREEYYYNELKEVGYRKHCQIIPPKVQRRFIELWGKKLTRNDIV